MGMRFVALQILKLTGRDPTTIEKLGCGAFAGLVAQSGEGPIAQLGPTSESAFG
jgi:hypothetical protein